MLIKSNYSLDLIKENKRENSFLLIEGFAIIYWAETKIYLLKVKYQKVEKKN